MDKEVLFKEFRKLEELKKGDFIKIEQYGGGPDESCLKGTKNALNHFAWEILKVTLDGKEEYTMDNYVAEDSVAGIDSIEVVEVKDGRHVEYIPSFKDRLVGCILLSSFILFILSAVFGFITAIKIILH
jgi:hypothetical protein